MIGKTIARIEESPTDPKYGSQRHGTMVLYFTDGTTAEITGHSYEEVDLTHGPGEHPRVYERAAQGRREAARINRLRAEERALLSPEERDRREAERRASMGPFARMVEDEIRALTKSYVADFNRQAFGSAVTIPVGGRRGKARRS